MATTESTTTTQLRPAPAASQLLLLLQRVCLLFNPNPWPTSNTDIGISRIRLLVRTTTLSQLFKKGIPVLAVRTLPNPLKLLTCAYSGNYGSYKREAEAEAAPEPIPEAEAEIVEKRVDYGKYGDYGSTYSPINPHQLQSCTNSLFCRLRKVQQLPSTNHNLQANSYSYSYRKG